MLLKQDIAAGALFMLAGAAGLYFGASLDVGSLSRIGPGFAPKALSFGLIAMGLVIALRDWRRDVALELPQIRPVLVLLGGLAIFTLLIGTAGLFPTAIATTLFLTVAMGTPRPVQSMVIAVAFAGLITVVFVYGLHLSVRAFWW